MPHYRAQFRGLNTDIPACRMPSGTAREAKNVTLADGRLAKRWGFTQFEGDVTGAGDSVLGLFVARFDDGTVAVVAKCDDGKLYQREVYPSDAGSFTELPTEQTHDSTNAGWDFMWKDRWHYCDSGGASRWHPDHLSTNSKAYKAGQYTPATGPSAAAAAQGEKHGKYHVHYSYYNSDTKEEGQISPPSLDEGLNDTTACDVSGSTGGITVTAAALPAAYECDSWKVYSSYGNTETFHVGAASVECFSYRVYVDAISDSNPIGCNKADHVLDPQSLVRNEGGEPAGSTWGTWTGRYAVYGGLSSSMIEFSKPGFPCMIPRTVSYTAGKNHGGSDIKSLDPIPWEGQIHGALAGPDVAIESAAGVVAVYTATRIYQLRTTTDGQLTPVEWARGPGCVGSGAVASTGREIHALGYGAWTATTSRGWQDLSAERWATTLREIPGGYESAARMAYDSRRDQMWCAVVKSGETVAQRILVLDRRVAEIPQLCYYEPACLDSDEGITAMVELGYPGLDAGMLVATSAGQILRYTENQTTDAGTDFAAAWRGVFGTERSAYSQRVVRVEIQAGDDCAQRVQWTFQTKRASGDDPPERTGRVQQNNAINGIGDVGLVDGRMFELEFSSPAMASSADAVTWKIDGLTMVVDRTDRK